MRAKPFTFKKTKRVVSKFNAISIDLTVKEASDLAAYLRYASTPDGRFTDLYDALSLFVKQHGVESDLVAAPGESNWCFLMKKRVVT